MKPSPRMAALVIAAMLCDQFSFASHADGIDLTLTHGSGPGQVSLSWAGGQPDYVIHRSTSPIHLLDPAHRVATSSGTQLVDEPPAGQVHYYEVASLGGTPLIESITPPGASFGDLISIYGSGFGTNRSVVQVRFSYSESGESLVIDQPVFEATGTSLTLMVPLAVPGRLNSVQVLVGAVGSNTVDYLVGALPPDPTPAQAGNEVESLIDDLDLLMERVDGKVDAWLLETSTLPQASVGEIRQALTQGRFGLAELRTYIAAEAAGNPEVLHVLDVFLGGEAYGLLRAKLQAAIAALEGSPLGRQMCEGRVEDDSLADVLDVLDTLTQVIDVFVTAIRIICATLAIISLFTGGSVTPIAAILCGTAMSIATRLMRVINTALKATANAMRAIPQIAPVRVIPTTFFANTLHAAWGFDQPVAYVNGAIPIVARSFATFDNPRCNPSGCLVYVGVSEIEDDQGDPIGVELTDIKDASECGPAGLFCPGLTPIGVPYRVVPDLRMDTMLTFERVGALDAFHEVPVPFATPEGDRGFTGSDVHGPASDGWRRGDFTVKLTTPDCGGVALPEVTRILTLVSGPLLFDVQPDAAQLGQEVALIGQYMPRDVANDPVRAEALFGDAAGVMNMNSAANRHTLYVPDTTNAAGTIGLRVDGRVAQQVLPFDVLPPVLSSVVPAAPFPGEDVRLIGSGFALDPNRNHLTLDGQPIPILSGTGNTEVVFKVPAGSNGGMLQLTAMGVHVSNELPLPVARWSASAALSHPARDAMHPVLAVAPDGTAGVAWIDRHGGGGAARLMFTDAAPGDAAFRMPIEVSSDVMGPAGAPTSPDLAVGPDGRFHVLWVRTNGTMALVSLAKGAAPGAEITVDVPAEVYRDPSIAVDPGGVIHVAAIDVPLDATPHNTLVYMNSVDGGLTFGNYQELHGPNVSSPWNEDIFHVGDPDLSADAGGLRLAYTKGCLDDCDTLPGFGIAGRGVFVRTSADAGQSWGAPVMVHRAPTIFDGDLPHPFGPVPNHILHRRPSVAGDAAGAIVAWERPTVGAHASGSQYGTLAVSVNSEPFDITARLTLTPTTQDYQNDEGLPSLAHHAGAVTQTSVAWVERVPGVSPDLVSGVPRILFNRSTDRLASLGIATSLTPTTPMPDPTAIDGEPSLGADGSGRLHLAWVRGPEGNRVVRYTSLGTAYGDAPADDPPLVPDDPRSTLAIDIENTSTESVNLNVFHGTILYDPDHDREVRWVGTSTRTGAPNPQHDRPSFSPAGKMLYRGSMDFLGPTLVDLDGRQHLFASDDLSTGDIMSALTSPIFLPDGRVVAGRRLSPVQVQIVISGLASAQFFAITPPFTASDLELDVSPGGRYLVYEDVSANPDEIVILDLATFSELDRRPGRNPVWYPFDEGTGEFFVGYVMERAIPGPAVENVLVEVSTFGSYEEMFVTDPNGFIGRLAYSPDGSELAFDCKLCGDAAADADGASSIRLNNANDYVPREPGSNSFSPEFSPTSDAIAFMRNDAPVLPDTSMQLMIWYIGDPDAEEHLGPAVGDTPAGFPLRAPRLVWK